MLWGCHLIVVENVKIFARKEQNVPPPFFFLSAESIGGGRDRERGCLFAFAIVDGLQ